MCFVLLECVTVRHGKCLTREQQFDRKGVDFLDLEATRYLSVEYAELCLLVQYVVPSKYLHDLTRTDLENKIMLLFNVLSVILRKTIMI